MIVNITALDKAIAWAADEELQRASGVRWDQMEWMNDCGTACCIAGRLALDAGYVPVIGHFGMVAKPDDSDSVYSVVNVATRILLGPGEFDDELVDCVDDLFAGDDELVDCVDDLFAGFNGLTRLRARRDALAVVAERRGIELT